MSEPQEAAEFRGKTLSPVSPKPRQFPHPSNIPILEQSSDSSFSETMMQNLHPNTFPSMAQHTFGVPSNVPGAEAHDDKVQSSVNEEMEDSAIGSERDATSEHVRTTEQGVTETEHNAANQSFLQGTNSSFNVPSEALPTATSDAESALGSDHASDYEPSTVATSHVPFQQASTRVSDHHGIPIPSSADALHAPEAGLDALLTNLTQPPAHAGPFALPSSFPNGNGQSSLQVLPNHPNLPPKPPAQDKPVTHPNYTPGDDIRTYHPHNHADPTPPYRNALVLPNVTTNGLPPPPNAYANAIPTAVPVHSPARSSYGPRDGTPASTGCDDDLPFDYQLLRQYDAFLAFERNNVAEGQWDKFPTGSRLFIGNLLTEKTTKRDVFRKFHAYGPLAQISLKTAFGFVQFLDSKTCARALEVEQGKKLQGRQMHLEISKPQKNTRNARRSRSPDFNRSRGQQAPRGVDRYTSGPQVSPRDHEFRRQRDDYRPERSLSPRTNRGSDRYDGRFRTRSRSPYGRGARRSSPARADLDDNLLLPRRTPQDVPDVQIVASDDVNVRFIEWVETSFKNRGVRVQVLLLTQHLSEAAVLRRQIVEGVQALVRLVRAHEMNGRIALQIFDRRGGVDNVKFEQYEDLEPTIAAELVIRAKLTHGAPQVGYGIPLVASSYGIPPSSYGYQQAQPMRQFAPVLPPSSNSNVSNILSSFNVSTPASNPEIARILASAQQTQAQQLPAGPDVARILDQFNNTSSQTQHQKAPVSQYGHESSLSSGSQYPGGMAQHAHVHPPRSQQAPPPQTHNLQQILAGLTAYRRPD